VPRVKTRQEYTFLLLGVKKKTRACADCREENVAMAAMGGGGAHHDDGELAAADSITIAVRRDALAWLSEELGGIFRSVRRHHELELEWELRARVTGGDQRTLAGQLHGVMNFGRSNLVARVSSTLQGLDKAIDSPEPPSRRPADVFWWLLAAGGGDADLGLRPRHLPRAQVALARDLLAEASARAERLTEPEEQLRRDHSHARRHHSVWAIRIPALLERLRLVQRLTDDILVPLRALERLVDHLDGRTPKPPPRRGSSASPAPRGSSQRDVQVTTPPIRRTNSISC
jgi:hypothetical protein